MGWSLAKTVHFKGNSRQYSQGRVWKRRGIWWELNWEKTVISWFLSPHLPAIKPNSQKKGRKTESSTLDFHITYTWDNPILAQRSSCRGFGAQVGTLGGEQVGLQYLPWWLSLTWGSAIIKTVFRKIYPVQHANWREIMEMWLDIHEILLFTF